MQQHHVVHHSPPPRGIEEEMIPVKRGGCMFFVPLSQATPEELRVHLGGSGAGDSRCVIDLQKSE